MKTFFPKLIVILLSTLLPLLLPAQKTTELPDVLQMIKSKKAGKQYIVNHASIREIRLGYDRPHRHPFPGGRSLNDSLNYTGPAFEVGLLSLQTVRARTFLLRGTLDCSNPGLDWEVALFSEGLVDKTWNKEKQEDGSFSISTEKTTVLFWDKGAGGMIVEKGDTIGRFYIAMNPRTEQFLQQYTDKVYLNEVSPVESFVSNPGNPGAIMQPGTDYGIYGIIRNQNFAVLANGETFQSFIYFNSDLVGVFRSDIDFQPMIKKANRLQPYLLYNNSSSIVFQNDLIRLALLSRLLMEVLGGNVF